MCAVWQHIVCLLLQRVMPVSADRKLWLLGAVKLAACPSHMDQRNVNHGIIGRFWWRYLLFHLKNTLLGVISLHLWIFWHIILIMVPRTWRLIHVLTNSMSRLFIICESAVQLDTELFSGLFWVTSFCFCCCLFRLTLCLSNIFTYQYVFMLPNQTLYIS